MIVLGRFSPVMFRLDACWKRAGLRPPSVLGQLLEGGIYSAQAMYMGWGQNKRVSVLCHPNMANAGVETILILVLGIYQREQDNCCHSHKIIKLASIRQ